MGMPTQTLHDGLYSGQDGSETHQRTYSLEEHAASIARRIQAEPKLMHALYRLLGFCKRSRSIDEVVEKLFTFPEMRGSAFTPMVIFSWMVDAGAIEQDIAEDMSRPDEERHTPCANSSAVLVAPDERYRITQAGLLALEEHAEEDSLAALMRSYSQYESVFVSVLQFCRTPQSKQGIEDFLHGNPLLESPRLFAGFFIDKLEQARALTWDKGWVSTPEGVALADKERKG